MEKEEFLASIPALCEQNRIPTFTKGSEGSVWGYFCFIPPEGMTWDQKVYWNESLWWPYFVLIHKEGDKITTIEDKALLIFVSEEEGELAKEQVKAFVSEYNKRKEVKK